MEAAKAAAEEVNAKIQLLQEDTRKVQDEVAEMLAELPGRTSKQALQAALPAVQAEFSYVAGGVLEETLGRLRSLVQGEVATAEAQVGSAQRTAGVERQEVEAKGELQGAAAAVKRVGEGHDLMVQLEACMREMVAAAESRLQRAAQAASAAKPASLDLDVAKEAGSHLAVQQPKRASENGAIKALVR
jgi:hypothetical protein